MGGHIVNADPGFIAQRAASLRARARSLIYLLGVTQLGEDTPPTEAVQIRIGLSSIPEVSLLMTDNMHLHSDITFYLSDTAKVIDEVVGLLEAAARRFENADGENEVIADDLEAAMDALEEAYGRLRSGPSGGSGTGTGGNTGGNTG